MQQFPTVRAGKLFQRPLAFITVPVIAGVAGFTLIWCGLERRETSAEPESAGRNLAIGAAADYPLAAKPLVPVRTTYPATLVQVIDGETLEVYVDLGFGIRTKQRITLDGIKVPAKGKSPQAAKQHLASLLTDRQLVLELSKVRDGNYGRIFLEDNDSGKISEDLSSRMIKDGFARTEIPLQRKHRG